MFENDCRSFFLYSTLVTFLKSIQRIMGRTFEGRIRGAKMLMSMIDNIELMSMESDIAEHAKIDSSMPAAGNKTLSSTCRRRTFVLGWKNIMCRSRMLRFYALFCIINFCKYQMVTQFWKIYGTLQRSTSKDFPDFEW